MQYISIAVLSKFSNGLGIIHSCLPTPWVPINGHSWVANALLFSLRNGVWLAPYCEGVPGWGVM